MRHVRIEFFISNPTPDVTQILIVTSDIREYYLYDDEFEHDSITSFLRQTDYVINAILYVS